MATRAQIDKEYEAIIKKRFPKGVWAMTGGKKASPESILEAVMKKKSPVGKKRVTKRKATAKPRAVRASGKGPSHAALAEPSVKRIIKAAGIDRVSEKAAALAISSLEGFCDKLGKKLAEHMAISRNKSLMVRAVRDAVEHLKCYVPLMGGHGYDATAHRGFSQVAIKDLFKKDLHDARFEKDASKLLLETCNNYIFALGKKAVAVAHAAKKGGRKTVTEKDVKAAIATSL